MIYTVKDIEEPDFGCEGLMDGQQVIDKVTLIDEKGNLLYIEAADMYLYGRNNKIIHRKEEYYG